jgi:hypothetical protein
VCDEKTNVCEPLLTHRNEKRWHRNRGRYGAPGQRHALCVSVARELPARGPGGARCIGGVSSSQALAGKGRTCRLDAGGQPPQADGLAGRREGGPQVADTTRGRVPMRGTGADRPVIAMKGL